MKNLVVIGSGGFSKQVIEIIEKLNCKKSEFNLIGIIDDNKEFIGHEVLGYKIIGTTEYIMDYSQKNEVYGIIAISNGEVRERIVRKLVYIKWINLIHPSVEMSKYVKLGVGNIICAGVIINPECNIGNHVHINIGTTVGHDVSMMDYVTIMPGSNISGNVLLKEKSMVGTGAKVIQGLKIEESVILGAGAVLTKNTEKSCIYVGIPAKKKS
jgi:sugar O-acyltransferase (sialic acid O-acetyltransferase NeuD family)